MMDDKSNSNAENLPVPGNNDEITQKEIDSNNPNSKTSPPPSITTIQKSASQNDSIISQGGSSDDFKLIWDEDDFDQSKTISQHSEELDQSPSSNIAQDLPTKTKKDLVAIADNLLQETCDDNSGKINLIVESKQDSEEIFFETDKNKESSEKNILANDLSDIGTPGAITEPIIPAVKDSDILNITEDGTISELSKESSDSSECNTDKSDDQNNDCTIKKPELKEDSDINADKYYDNINSPDSMETQETDKQTQKKDLNSKKSKSKGSNTNDDNYYDDINSPDSMETEQNNQEDSSNSEPSKSTGLCSDLNSKDTSVSAEENHKADVEKSKINVLKTDDNVVESSPVEKSIVLSTLPEIDTVASNIADKDAESNISVSTGEVDEIMSGKHTAIEQDLTDHIVKENSNLNTNIADLPNIEENLPKQIENDIKIPVEASETDEIASKIGNPEKVNNKEMNLVQFENSIPSNEFKIPQLDALKCGEEISTKKDLINSDIIMEIDEELNIDNGTSKNEPENTKNEAMEVDCSEENSEIIDSAKCDIIDPLVKANEEDVKTIEAMDVGVPERNEDPIENQSKGDFAKEVIQAKVDLNTFIEATNADNIDSKNDNIQEIVESIENDLSSQEKTDTTSAEAPEDFQDNNDIDMDIIKNNVQSIVNESKLDTIENSQANVDLTDTETTANIKNCSMQVDTTEKTVKSMEVLPESDQTNVDLITSAESNKGENNKFIDLLEKDQSDINIQVIQGKTDPIPTTEITNIESHERTNIVEEPTKLKDRETPSTSKDFTGVTDNTPDMSDEVPEITDSLGLLAESSGRLIDDEQDDIIEQDDDDGDDDDDDQDDESNLPPIDQSEESNMALDVDVQSPKDLENDKIDINMAEDDVMKTKSPDPTVNEDSNLEPIEEIETVETTGPKKKKMQITKSNTILSIVDLEESSDEDPLTTNPVAISPDTDKISVNIPMEVDVMSTSGTNNSEMVTKAGDVVISGLPKPVTKVARLNTSEISIKTTNASAEDKIVIPEKMMSGAKDNEVFNLDSDDDEQKESTLVTAKDVPTASGAECMNSACTSDPKTIKLSRADPIVVRYYDTEKKKKSIVCESCALDVYGRMEYLTVGIKSVESLLSLDMSKPQEDLVEISDSDSEGDEKEVGTQELIGEMGADLLDKHMASLINDTWVKYKMDERLAEARNEIMDKIEKLEMESKEIESLLNVCQKETDDTRDAFYSTFSRKIMNLPELIINDELFDSFGNILESENNLSLRRSTRSKDKDDIQYSSEMPTKKQEEMQRPAWIPPSGPLIRSPLSVGLSVLAMKHAFGSWTRAHIEQVTPKPATGGFSSCRVKFENKVKAQVKVLPARHLAYSDPATVLLPIGTRVVALFEDPLDTSKKSTFYSGVVAEMPSGLNNFRYLVFFDDGYAQYIKHPDMRVVCETSQLVWEEVHPFSREFVKQYLLAYPQRPMVKLTAGQSVRTEWNGKWWDTQVTLVDASLVQVFFKSDKRTEWIYRGSTRLAPMYMELKAAGRLRNRPMPRSFSKNAPATFNMPYVEYTRSDEQEKNKTNAEVEQDMRKQRAVAKKSTVQTPTPVQPSIPQQQPDSIMSRVVYYTPKSAVKPYKMVPHKCNVKCKRTDVLPLKELRTYNPLAKPLLSGWERQIVRYKFRKSVIYRAPCGRRIRNLSELHHYLRITNADMGVDLFDFNINTHCLAEFVLNKCLVSKKDLSNGKENVPVPCVNYYDTSLPEFCSYNTERTPTAGVPLNLDENFLCGCDCVDDCKDKSKCACWKMTVEGAKTIGMDVDEDIGYVYKRLLEPVPSGIYECNSRCKCKATCLNRVAQHPLQLKLQVFKTLNRGWGIRALNDVPKGAFLCVYAGNLLTDATANLDGLNEGDEYLAELDYIEVVEQMKEGYEENVPEKDLVENSGTSDEDDEPIPSDEEKPTEDRDFKLSYQEKMILEDSNTSYQKTLRRRNKNQEKKDEIEKQKRREDDCITISDDEEVREPSHFMAKDGMQSNDYVSKYKSVRAHYGEDEACYIMDAKVQGNIGRYLNHSCTPNVFVQNVFVDTHDPRFPWVAFFALSHIKAGTELTWNYNYDIGSVPGKVLYCYCGAPNCRGRLL